MGAGQRLGSLSLDKERSNILHTPCLSQPGYIPIQPFSGLSTSLIYAFPYKYSDTEYVGKKQTPQGVTWQAVSWKGNVAPCLPEPAVSNEQSHVLRLYYFHSPSQAFCVLDSRDELARLPAVSTGSTCPRTFAGRKHKWEGWDKSQCWFLLRLFCFPLFCLISSSYSKSHF